MEIQTYLPRRVTKLNFTLIANVGVSLSVWDEHVSCWGLKICRYFFIIFYLLQASPKGIYLQLDGVFLWVLKDLLLVILCCLSGKWFYCVLLIKVALSLLSTSLICSIPLPWICHAFNTKTFLLTSASGFEKCGLFIFFASAYFIMMIHENCWFFGMYVIMWYLINGVTQVHLLQ
jgi:hypothetical protein